MQSEDRPDVASPASQAQAAPAQSAPDTAAPDMAATSPMKGRNWGGITVFVLGAGSILLALLAGLGSGWGLWEFRFGFLLLMAAFGVAIASLLIGVGIGWWARRKGRVSPRPMRWIG
ncbi:MAG: hypothetical protein ACK450_06075, partial [Sphingomonadales bacterium]